MTVSTASRVLVTTSLAVCFVASLVCAEVPRALPAGQLPNDIRLQPPKDLDGYFPFAPANSAADWTRRAERVRRQMLVTLGLWPTPTPTPLNAVVHGKVERDDYTVERVYFESLPGFYVTGSLYRPKSGGAQKRPGVLCPHGHWADGRFHEAGAEAVRKEIVQGAERFEEGGRSPLQARCVQLARLGCVVFHYDMIGYADSVQIPQSLAHGFAKQRPEMNTPEGWGLFSPQAEEHYQSVMGLQTWNSIRALDFLLGLPEVDAERMGVTGASGGGTQTFILCALDQRPALAFPAVMVSTAMQGGCTCENASSLRVDTGNVEFAALFAPKPLGLTCADDWTREMATKGFPELKQQYTLLGTPDNVMLKRGEQFGHNYNYVSRAAMYSWVNRHFKLGLPEPIVEADYHRLSRAEMSVWDAQHPKPEGGPDFERRLLRWLTEDAEKQLQTAQSSTATFRRVYGGGWDVVLGRNLAEVGDVTWELKQREDRDALSLEAGLLRHTPRGEELPLVRLRPKNASGATVIWAHPEGIAGLFAPVAGGQRSEPKPEVQQLLAAGLSVVGVDMLFQGSFVAEGQAVTQTRRVKNPREAAAYTFGYNHALFAQRVHDLLTVIKHVQGQQVKAVGLVGLAGAGPWVAAACAQAQGAVTGAIVETDGFRFGNVRDLQSVDFLPGGAKYGDLPGLLALAAPTPLWVGGETESALALARAQYRSAGVERALARGEGDEASHRAAALAWLRTQLKP